MPTHIAMTGEVIYLRVQLNNMTDAILFRLLYVAELLPLVESRRRYSIC